MQSTYKHVKSPIKFPDGTTSLTEVTTKVDHNPVKPVFHVRDSDGIISILQAAARQTVTSIEIPFFPYARQDHPPHCDLQTFIRALDAQRKTLLRVSTFDPHSEALELLFNETKHLLLEVKNHELISSVGHFSKEVIKNKPILVLPDAGAAKKYLNIFAESFDSLFEGYVQCTKHRDPATGALSNFAVHDPRGYLLKPNTQFVIVDDICDGGGTFLGIANEFQKAHIPKERLNLYISHGLFTKGTDALFNLFNKIATTNSIATSKDARLIYYDIFSEE